jgi:hypothetical protein
MASATFQTVPADSWLVTAPRPILIGPFPTEAAALAWGQEWTMKGETQASQASAVAPAGEELPVFAPSDIAAHVLKAMEVMDRVSDGQA